MRRVTDLNPVLDWEFGSARDRDRGAHFVGEGTRPEEQRNQRNKYGHFSSPNVLAISCRPDSSSTPITG